METKEIKKPSRGEFVHKAILQLAANKKWRIIGDFTYEDLIWEDDSVSPTKEQVESKADELELEYDNNQYRLQRVPEYPPIGDQLDALWKGGEDAEEMLAKVQAVKAKYPKPE